MYLELEPQMMWSIKNPFEKIFEKKKNLELNQKKKFRVIESKENDKAIYLCEPIDFNIEITKEGFYYDNTEYNIYTFGATQKEAEDNIYEELLNQYRIYAMEEDANLDKRAKELKYKLLRLCGDLNA